MLILSGASAAGGWLIAIVEAIGVWLFRPWAFDVGPIAVVQEIRTNAVPPFVRPAEGKADTFIYRVRKGQCFFRGRAFSPHRKLRTPLEIKGTMTSSGNAVTVVGRFPLGSTIFLSGWLGAWSALAILWASRGGSISGVLFCVAGWVVFGTLVSYSKRYERRLFAQVSDDVLSELRHVEPHVGVSRPVHG